MATESPMRIVESRGATKWASSKDSAVYASPFSNLAAEELGLLLQGNKIYGGQSNTVPYRSGSAPPSMEGSFAAFGDLVAQQSSNHSSGLTNLTNMTENYQSEEELRADPSYVAFYFSNLCLNPRLPPPNVSRENRHLVRHIGSSGNSWRLTSFDDSGRGTLHLSKYSLSTHNEEPEDEKPPLQVLGDKAESYCASLTGSSEASLTVRHKSLVDLIQEDFPRTPSPVYNQSHSPSHATMEEPINNDIQAISLDVCSVDNSKLHRSGECSVDVHVKSRIDGANACGLTANGDSLVASLPVNPNSHIIQSSLSSQKVEVVGKDVSLVTHGATELDPSRILLNVDSSINKEQKQFVEKNVQQWQQHHHFSQPSTTCQVHGSASQRIAQGMNRAHNGMEQNPHPMFSSVEMPPVLQPPGLAPPLYATAAAYSRAPLYPILGPSGFYAPQHSMGGYPLNSQILPQFIAGYPSHDPMAINFDATSGQNFSVPASGIRTGERIPHVGGLQHLNKFYGQHGSMVQPSFLDPFQMLYFQQPFEDLYGASGQYGRLTSTGVIMGQGDFYDIPQESTFSGYRGDQNFQASPNSSLSSPSLRKGGNPTAFYGTPPSIGAMEHFSASGSPILPGSPIGANYFGSSEVRFSQGSIRDLGGNSGWQGQRGSYSVNDSKKHSFLEELKSSSARNFDLSDIAGRIVEFSVDQHGSRFIQQKLENCSLDDKASVFEEVVPYASKLMIDVFGNYVIQKFFEHGSHDQRRKLADQLSGQMLNLSLQMYGCRVIQKALEVIDLDQKTRLVYELDGHVMRCVRDQNGNHVIQKCIECIPTVKIEFIISAFQGQVGTLSTHPYGCRVIQRVLEHCSDESQSQCIVDEILESAYVLAQDQYGNYVTQHVLERGRPLERSQIISKLTGKVVQMSQHKYASNVVEKCLEYGDAAEREFFIDEILGHSEENDNLLTMVKDQYANYVVQKILEISNDKQREVLLSRIGAHLHALKKYTYGKHIVARFEQLSGEESVLLE